MKLNRLAKYLLTTFLISWIAWGALVVLINTGVTTFVSPLGFIIFGIGGLGPTIAAIAVQEKRTPKSIAKYVFSGKHRAVPIVLLFCVLLAATIYLSSRELLPEMLLYLFPVYWLAMTVIGGGLEELGWRGVMQPALEKSLPFPVAVFLTSVAWSGWHLPLWFVAGSSQQAFPFASFAAFGVVLSFAMAAIHKKTKCVLYSCVFHGFSNALMSYFIVGVNWFIALGSIVIIAVSLLIWYTEKDRGAGL